MTSDDIHTLTETIIYDLTKAFALPQTEGVKGWIRLVFGRAARRTLQSHATWTHV